MIAEEIIRDILDQIIQIKKDNGEPSLIVMDPTAYHTLLLQKNSPIQYYHTSSQPNAVSRIYGIPFGVVNCSSETTFIKVS